MAARRTTAGQRDRLPRRGRGPADAAGHTVSHRVDDQAGDGRDDHEPGRRGQADAQGSGCALGAGAGRRAGARRSAWPVGPHPPGEPRHPHRGPTHPYQRPGIRILGVRPDRQGLHAAAVQPGPGRVAGRTGQAAAGAPTRRAGHLQPLHRPAGRHRFPHRRQAVPSGSRRTDPGAGGHDRHRVLRHRRGAAARGDHVPAHQRAPAAARGDGPAAPHAAVVLQCRRRVVVERRRLPALRANAARRRNDRRGAGARRSPCG